MGNSSSEEERTQAANWGSEDRFECQKGLTHVGIATVSILYTDVHLVSLAQ